MINQEKSGKSMVWKGATKYLWEEMKTLNTKKIKALTKMLGGYFLIKTHKKVQSQSGQYGRIHYLTGPQGRQIPQRTKLKTLS